MCLKLRGGRDILTCTASITTLFSISATIRILELRLMLTNRLLIELASTWIVNLLLPSESLPSLPETRRPLAMQWLRNSSIRAGALWTRTGLKQQKQCLTPTWNRTSRRSQSLAASASVCPWAAARAFLCRLVGVSRAAACVTAMPAHT